MFQINYNEKKMKNPLLLSVLTLLLISCGIDIKPVEKNDHWHERVSKFEKGKNEIQDGCAIFLGNSIIEGFDLEEFFPEMNAINRGISSDHIDGVIDRLNICLGDAKNAKLFVLVGINDIGAGRTEESIKYLYNELVNLIVKNYTYDVYLHSILPTSPKWKNCPPELIKNINIYIEKLAEEHDLNFVNIYPLFLKDNSEYVNDELMKDGLHPNDAGYEIWADYLKKAVSSNPHSK